MLVRILRTHFFCKKIHLESKMDFFAFSHLKHLIDYVTITDYEDLVLWPQDYMPAFREYKRRYGHLIIPNNYVHRDGTLLGMLVRHINLGYATIPDRHFNELINVLGFRTLQLTRN